MRRRLPLESDLQGHQMIKYCVDHHGYTSYKYGTIILELPKILNHYWYSMNCHIPVYIDI